ncbi:hypothetical protein ZIOFF_012147 [Zingiber officinale]|uniref:Transposase-associated domain-containing protein n=1 Tax=Zingiber officinale TaxID=94328 RepID=A0A8J5I9A1_ZINOF|nr:hypothetical protein ZIOFF_012147 [Zingiber officinale]
MVVRKYKNGHLALIGRHAPFPVTHQAAERCLWSPEGSILGVAFSKHLVQIYAFNLNEELRQHLEIDAHIGSVNDIAFSYPKKTLSIITCSNDKAIKVPLHDEYIGVGCFNWTETELYISSVSLFLSVKFFFSTSTDVHKLWQWSCDERNPSGKSTASVAPQLRQPPNGILMTNERSDNNPEEATACIALSKNDSYATSASGGKVSLLNMRTFKEDVVDEYIDSCICGAKACSGGRPWSLACIIRGFKDRSEAFSAKAVKIGVMVNPYLPTRREQEAAIRIAARHFNSSSPLVLRFNETNDDPVETSTTVLVHIFTGIVMDKGWMFLPKQTEEYRKGLENFLDFAFSNANINGTIACPCARCKIGICVSREEAYDHLTVDGFIKGYTHWVAHGEIACSAPSISSSVLSRDDVDNMEGLVHDAFGVQQHYGSTINTAGFEKDKDIPFGETEKFYKLIDDSQKELYPGSSGFALGKVIATKFDDETLKKAHQYVLFNCHHIERMHSESFASWFAKHIENTNPSQDDPISNDLKSLARGPNFIGIRYEKFLSNGFRFHTKEVERKRKTQNCGVIVRATTSSYSSIRDQNPISSELDYYGILQNVIELDYEGGRIVVLFECDWVSKGKRLKLDEDGFMLANFTNVKRHNKPYILASQAMQVFYVEDPVDCNWHVIITTDARGQYKMQPVADVDTYLQSCICNPEDDHDHEEIVWVRDDAIGVEIDVDT